MGRLSVSGGQSARRFALPAAMWSGVRARGAAVASALALSCWAFGQAGQSPLAFDVASVKPASTLPGRGGGGTRSTRDGIEFLPATLRYCICYAYGVQDYQVSGPGWIGTLRYDIVAKISRSGDPRKIPEMLQTLLADRFGLRVHHEKRDFQGYAMVAGPGGPRLQKPGTDDDKKILADLGGIPPQALILHEPQPSGGQKMMGVHATMEYLAKSLSLDMGCPIVDLTNLHGNYNFVLEMSREDMRNGMNASSGRAREDDPGASVFSSIQRLGLRLRPQKVSLDLILVDHAEKVPTAN